ncbi:MAG: hypothetical protein MHM6MM_000005 [Cercozoa sp. M6MM]
MVHDGKRGRKGPADEPAAKRRKNSNNGKLQGNKNKKRRQKREPESAESQNARTAFVRNVPVDASEQEVARCFEVFGPVEYAKLVKHKSTGLNKGTAFVRFKSSSARDAAVAAASASDVKTKDDILSLTSGTSVELHGRPLVVLAAVVREEVGKFAERDEERDKRNLALAREGVETEATSENGLTEKQARRRAQQWKEKKEKLKNANYHLSQTRLSVHNLPPTVDENALKQLAVRTALRLRVLRRAVKQQEDNPDREWSAAQKKARDESRPATVLFADVPAYQHGAAKIKSVSVARDPSRQRSLCYGFVEFREHADSLAVLRELSCNPNADPEGVIPEGRRLQVEFALVDARKVHLLRERVRKIQRNKQLAEQRKPKEQQAPVKLRKSQLGMPKHLRPGYVDRNAQFQQQVGLADGQQPWQSSAKNHALARKRIERRRKKQQRK